MTTTDVTVEASRETSTEEFVERVFGAVLGAMEMQAMYLGHRLGWYRALADGAPLTSVELAERTGTSERYAREWLEHQAVSGYLTVDNTEAAPAERRFSLPPAQAEVLTDEDSLAYLAPFAQFVGGLGKHIDELAEAYASGGGVSWAEFGADYREAQAAANRPMFLHQLGQELLPAIPEVHTRLEAGARVADVGCGAGWSAIGIAKAYPEVTVHGFDLDEPSIEMARANAVEAGVAERLRFDVADAAAVTGAYPYDVVFAFECIHDLSDPVRVLTAMRGLAGSDGAVVVMDERVEERFTAPAGEVERLFYGFSLACCLPDGLSHQPSVGTGTVMRPDTLAGYAREAGFADAEVLDVHHDIFRFYRLRG